MVFDVDIVIQPEDYFAISTKLGAEYKMVASPHKYTLDAEGFKTEIWLANSIEEFEVLKLVKTGSAGFNLQLAMNAHDKDMTLMHKNGLYGLYAAVKGWDKEKNKFKYYHNPLRRLWYSEHDIIMIVFEDEKYLDPHNRNIAFDPTTKWIEDA